MRIALVVAAAENDVIGRDNALPWHLPADLKHFKALTLGKPIIMGRKTFESIGRPLPGRTNIVLTRQAGFAPAGVRVAGNLDDALAMAQAQAAADGVDEIMVIGGAALYAEARGRADRIYLTRVHARPDGDARFLPPGPAEWACTARTPCAGEAAAGGLSCTFETWDRVI